jgi:large subunit ribosomal protein L13
MATLQTQSTKQASIKREWHLIDVKDVVLGRISSQIAQLLMGKAKPYFVRNIDCGDYVVVVNAKNVATTGNKELQKVYFNYSGYPGGLRQEKLQDLRKRRPEEVIYHAVKGMLPQNKLRDKMLARLFIFPTGEHTYNDKFKTKSDEKGASKSQEVKSEE